MKDTMLLELDTTPAPTRSPSSLHTASYTTPHSHSHPHVPSLSLQPLSSSPTPTGSVDTPDKFQDVDPQELRRLYLAAMMSLKAERQQRINHHYFLQFLNNKNYIVSVSMTDTQERILRIQQRL